MGAPPKHTTRFRRGLTGNVAGIAPRTRLTAGAVVLAGLVGCAGGGGGASGYRLVSIETRASLSPTLNHGWFHAADENTADIYLTDLPPETLTSPEVLSGATGNIVHVRMLLRPLAGKTPIEPTALTASVVHVVLAGGQVGVYRGGGFMRPSGSTGEQTFGGSIVGGSVQLGAATPGFVDRLGSAQLSTGFRGERDPERVQEIRSALAWALTVAPPIAHESAPPESAEDPVPTAP